jgi:23S rRNA pseudouridine2605 synthase
MRKAKTPTRTKKPNTRHSGIARMLSKLGYCSRNQGFDLARSGRVAVNGTIRRDPEYPVRESDRITVDGEELKPTARAYLMMNKPRGLVTTASDEKGRATVYSLLPGDVPWLSPVGRLDLASEGLLLFTNDTQWANTIVSPDSHLDKTYRVQIASVACDALLERLRAGIPHRGETRRIVRASILRAGSKNSWIEIVLDEGRNRHIRRIFDALGIEVLRLIRVSVGPLELGDLAKGMVRPLRSAEKQALDGAISRARGTREPAKRSSSRRV